MKVRCGRDCGTLGRGALGIAVLIRLEKGRNSRRSDTEAAWFPWWRKCCTKERGSRGRRMICFFQVESRDSAPNQQG
jgi:hypothetical protein